jgi:hypothetical protein
MPKNILIPFWTYVNIIKKSVCQHQLYDVVLFLMISVTPAILTAELIPASSLADHIDRTTVRTYIRSIFNSVKVLEAFLPLFPAVLADNRTDIARKITAFNPDHLPMNQTVRNFFPGRK